MIKHKSFKHLTLVTIIIYNCQKVILIIRYNRLLTAKLGCGYGNMRPQKNIFGDNLKIII